jgi:hypothetical protein
MSSLIPLEEVKSKLDSIDLTKLSDFVRKLQDIDEGYNKNIAPGMMRDFIVAQDIASVLLARAVQAEMMAKSAVDVAEAIATLDKADDYFAAKGQKATDKMRQAYVALDPDVRAARDLHAKACAIVTLIKNRVYEFSRAYEAVKQLYKDTQQTSWEGM